ncbi:MAG: hypothetical protein WKF83_09850 [Nocardioidaceae bacterium]
MSSDHIRWDFAAADDFDAELSNEKAFNADSLARPTVPTVRCPANSTAAAARTRT